MKLTHFCVCECKSTINFLFCKILNEKNAIPDIFFEELKNCKAGLGDKKEMRNARCALKKVSVIVKQENKEFTLNV